MAAAPNDSRAVRIRDQLVDGFSVPASGSHLLLDLSPDVGARSQELRSRVCGSLEPLNDLPRTTQHEANANFLGRIFAELSSNFPGLGDRTLLIREDIKLGLRRARRYAMWDQRVELILSPFSPLTNCVTNFFA